MTSVRNVIYCVTAGAGYIRRYASDRCRAIAAASASSSWLHATPRSSNTKFVRSTVVASVMRCERTHCARIAYTGYARLRAVKTTSPPPRGTRRPARTGPGRHCRWSARGERAGGHRAAVSAWPRAATRPWTRTTPEAAAGTRRRAAAHRSQLRTAARRYLSGAKASPPRRTVLWHSRPQFHACVRCRRGPRHLRRHCACTF